MNARQRRRKARAWYALADDCVTTGTDYRYPLTARESAIRELAMLDSVAPRSLTRAGVARAVALLTKANL